jgi:hypothetical protein
MVSWRSRIGKARSEVKPRLVASVANSGHSVPASSIRSIATAAPVR